MALTTPKPSEGGEDFEPHSAGMHQAVCTGLIDLGTQPSYNPAFKPSRRVLFLFETPHETVEIDGKQMPRMISAEYTMSLHEKANMRKMLVNWRGRDFTKEELAGFDLFTVIGANCMLNVIHKQVDGGKTYANIASVNPLPKSMPKAEPVGEIRKWSIEEQPEGPIQLPDFIWDWVKEKIKKSSEYQWSHDHGGQGGESQQQAATVTNQSPDNGQAFPTDGEDEDVPF